MNIAYRAFARFYQKVVLVTTVVKRFRIPEKMEGEGCLAKVPEFIRQKEPDLKNLLIVTDKDLMRLGLLKPLLNALDEAGFAYSIYDETVPNPTVQNVDAALRMYQSNNCQGLLAFGGGSSMDCAKGVGAMLAKPNKTLAQMRGVMKIGKAIPPFFAIPTTAGTGSETTVAAILSDGNYKYSIMDPVLIPKYAILDPLVTVGLPLHVTSTTGIDALSHAVEAYIGINNTKLTKEYALRAVKAIFANLKGAYDDGSNIELRTNMQRAAYEAGISFTRTNVGYVHAIAHALGGQYHLPHGLAIAITMPHVLKKYGASAHKALAELADLIVLPGYTQEEKANNFIKAIEDLNTYMKIPSTINGNVSMKGVPVTVKAEDIPTMVNNAAKEANPLYPVPMIFTKDELAELFKEVAGL